MGGVEAEGGRFLFETFLYEWRERERGVGWSEFCVGLFLGGASGVVLSRRHFERYTFLLCDGCCVLFRCPARSLLFDAERERAYGTPWKGSRKYFRVMVVPTTVPCKVFFVFVPVLLSRLVSVSVVSMCKKTLTGHPPPRVLTSLTPANNSRDRL